jgi:hypothetical protein
MGRAPGNATDPIAGSGAQQTRSTDTEQAVEVVRNHEGGTGFDGSHHRTEGSASFREWTRRRSNGRGVSSGRIPREEEFGPLRRSRGVLAETRALWRRGEDHEGGHLWRRRRRASDAHRAAEGERPGKSSRTRPATVKVEEEAGKANDPLPIIRRGLRSAPPVRPSRRPEDPSNSTRADRFASAGRYPASAEPSEGIKNKNTLCKVQNVIIN